MGRPKTWQQVRSCIVKPMVVTAVLIMGGYASHAQTAVPAQKNSMARKPVPAQTNAPAASASDHALSEALQKYPGLLPELGQLSQKLQQNIVSPAPRTESRLLPLLPESTTYLAAFPNYGEVAHQSLSIFRQELQESAVLHDWWTHGDLATNGPKIEEFLDNFALLNQFLGDEILLFGSMDTEHKFTDGQNKSGDFLAMAEIRKPGLDKFLQQWINKAAITGNPGVRVLDVQGLATAQDAGSSKDLIVLVRPDLVVASSDLAALRGFNARLKNAGRNFASTPFGQRVAQEYQGGATLVAAADVHKILSQNALDLKEGQQNLQRSGFADMKFLVWKQEKIASQSVSEAELSFTGPRHGAAAWLAKPTPLNSLDFVSPKAMMALTIVFSSLPQMFDDIKELSGPANANTFTAIEGGQKALNLSLKDDLLGQLGGELTVELDSVTPPQPGWKAMLQVKDAAHLQKTLNTLLAVSQLKTEHVESAGLAYQLVQIPNQNAPLQIAYAFVDGYLVIASSPQALTEAVRLHRSGESLAKSARFLAALPSGRPAEASALFSQDPLALSGPVLRQIAPELADTLGQFAKEAPLSVVRAYGEESAIRTSSSSSSFDVTTVLIAGAVAIPNLLRSRMAANESSAVGSLRSMNTAQVTYATKYPKQGFARSLATLGSDSSGLTKYSEARAGLFDHSLANDNCSGETWCSKSGYQFRILTGCSKLAPCKEYLAVATPVDANTGTRSFCTTSDGIIHYKIGAPSTASLVVSQCRTWPPLK